MWWKRDKSKSNKRHGRRNCLRNYSIWQKNHRKVSVTKIEEKKMKACLRTRVLSKPSVSSKHMIWARNSQQPHSLNHYYRVTNTCQSQTGAEKLSKRHFPLRFICLERKSDSFDWSARRLFQIFETFFKNNLSQVSLLEVSMVILLSFGHLNHPATNDLLMTRALALKKIMNSYDLTYKSLSVYKISTKWMITLRSLLIFVKSVCVCVCVQYRRG